jgi:hypothetical protein
MSHRHALIVLAAAGAASVAALAAALPSSGDDLPGAPKVTKPPKLSSQLAAVAEAERRSGRGLAVARANGLYVVRGKVRVVAETRGTRQEARRAVLTVGGEIEAVHADLVQALVGPAKLVALSRQPAVVYVRAPRRPLPG